MPEIIPNPDRPAVPLTRDQDVHARWKNKRDVGKVPKVQAALYTASQISLGG
jgi:hypothetical protein